MKNSNKEFYTKKLKLHEKKKNEALKRFTKTTGTRIEMMANQPQKTNSFQFIERHINHFVLYSF